MVRVVTLPDGRVDFEAPIHMTDDQRKAFIEFLEGLVPEQANVVKVDEPEKKYNRDSTEMRWWTPDEYLLLVSGSSIPEIMAETGRTEMSVQAHLGWFPQAFFKWMRDAGYSGTPTAQMIQQFLKEMGK